MFRNAPTLVDVVVEPSAHITVCGDVHGQFYDLLNIFEMNGLPAEDNPYVFNGEPAFVLALPSIGTMSVTCHNFPVARWLWTNFRFFFVLILWAGLSALLAVNEV